MLPIKYKIYDKINKVSPLQYNKWKAENQVKKEEIINNLINIERDMGAKRLIILNQVHGTLVVDADQQHIDYASGSDGAVTSTPGIAIGIQTADCVPVLLFSLDENNKTIIGGVHCGWKSAKGKILENAVQLMRSKGALKIEAIIGPSIQQKSYEVSSEYYENFIVDNPSNKSFFIKEDGNPEKYLFDLPGFVVEELSNLDVNIRIKIEEDTYSMPEKYPSYRFCQHNNKEYKENILSVIMALV
jgi:YfiH family protein